MKKLNIRWQLVAYDILILLASQVLLLFYYRHDRLPLEGNLYQMALSLVCVLIARSAWGIYRQIWRYGGIQCYMRLLLADGCAFFANWILENLLPMHISALRLLCIHCLSLLGALAIRMVYRYAFKCGNQATPVGKFLTMLLHIFAGSNLVTEQRETMQSVRLAIIGAGKTGVALADELLGNAQSTYEPRCFVDISPSKADRMIHGLPVILEDERTLSRLKDYEIQEVVFALPHITEDQKKALYTRYLNAGYRIRVYDYPTMQTADSKQQIRDFDISELLFRKPIEIKDERTTAYYRDKVILITGGGGSIGSELCRQLAKMGPKKIILLDICENGAYDVQQELRIAYGSSLDIQIEICSICSHSAMSRVFEAHHPQIVINAAAHKHVPLMEHNCIEAVLNNVFGTKNLVDLCEAYAAERFMMVSTDKAVNPTNVMGATKRMCEMIVQSASTYGKVKYSATRFGNVLGSAGSVIPLFKRQIANGGPITLTDKRIVRYFMTIPEASQLVLQSGSMANNGELFVLDMGQPIKIYDLAQSMVRLSGRKDIEIREVGLRPGEKLYEELLVKTEELDKTENSLIFIERDAALSKDAIDEKLRILRSACDSGSDDAVRQALHQVVPTYKTAEEVNAKAEQAEEMQKVLATV